MGQVLESDPGSEPLYSKRTTGTSATAEALSLPSTTPSPFAFSSALDLARLALACPMPTYLAHHRTNTRSIMSSRPLTTAPRCEDQSSENDKHTSNSWPKSIGITACQAQNCASAKHMEDEGSKELSTAPPSSPCERVFKSPCQTRQRGPHFLSCSSLRYTRPHGGHTRLTDVSARPTELLHIITLKLSTTLLTG